MKTESFKFKTPAEITDFADNAEKQARMDDLWNNNLNGFTQQGMLNNAWNSDNTPPTTNYFNPIDGNPTSEAAQITWSPFPGRIAFNYPNLAQSLYNQYADTGVMPSDIINSPCNTASRSLVPYFPYGPRGWQDEYCEWAVTRNTSGKITRVMFTCENPEYWNSLWLIDPNKVVQLYQSILGNNSITIEDLSLPNVIDPGTSLPLYNPLNKWNAGTNSDANGGGAIHLTSTPNTLQTEIGLATASSILRNNPSGGTSWPSRDYNALLCNGAFGQKNRNSDPNIGGNVNTFVNNRNNVTLANPPGLYIQNPNFTSYQTPDGSDASSYWTVVRGQETIDGLPGNFILHAVYEVPASKNFVVGDIKINGSPIEWGSQIASTFRMQIVAAAYTGSVPTGYAAVKNKVPPFATPLQLFYQNVFETMYRISVPNPVNHPISLLSNSTYIPTTINVGASGALMVMTTAWCTAKTGDSSTYPTISFGDNSITAVVTSVQENVNYAVPGNSKPSPNKAIYFTLSVNQNASVGPKKGYITNAGQSQQAGLPAMLIVTDVTVQSYIGWQGTGINIEAGDSGTISFVSGSWTANPDINGGKLYGPDGNPTYINAKPGYTMPNKNEGALIGRINDTVFEVGTSAAIPAGLVGELFLCINDDLDGIYGAGLTDNSGSITVKVDIA